MYNKLNQFIGQLRRIISQNHSEIDAIATFLNPYLQKDKAATSAKNCGTIAIIFADPQTTTSFDTLTKTVAAWNRTLPIYHQLLKGESPRDIQIVEVQNGSIDFLVNIDLKVAVDLAELFKIGFQVFAAYLGYKKMVKPILDSYHGNKKLIGQEEEREKLMLENIGDAVRNQIEAQHKAAKKLDKAIDGTAIPKKIEQVANLVTSHIVKGNDLKLLTAGITHPHATEDNQSDPAQDLKAQSLTARREFRLVSKEAKQKLIEAYGKLMEPEQ